MAEKGDIHLFRSHIPKGQWFSYALIPLSSIMFPHIAIFCLTAKRLTSFKKTVIFYPLCILALWLPSVFLGAVASSRADIVATLAVGNEKGFADLQKRDDAMAATIQLAAQGSIPGDDPRLRRALPEMRRLANGNSDGVMVVMLQRYSPVFLAGILGAAIMACVMASDSQILALSTMWAEDVYRYYGGTSEAKRVWSARVFVVFCTLAAYLIALAVHQHHSIFSIAVQYAFTGYAALTPVMIACLFWKRSTKWGALAATLFIAGSLLAMVALQYATGHLAPKAPSAPPVALDPLGLLLREYAGFTFTRARFLPVLPITVGSALLVWIVSLMTRPPSPATIERYFPSRASASTLDPSAPAGAYNPA
jgi:Na+(H+)/acetate symporter ActP